jgi:hypothetical protein
MDQYTARVTKIHRDEPREAAEVQRAAGILMSRLNVSSAEAIAWLHDLSTATGVALVEVARDVIAAQPWLSRADRGAQAHTVLRFAGGWRVGSRHRRMGRNR